MMKRMLRRLSLLFLAASASAVAAAPASAQNDWWRRQQQQDQLRRQQQQELDRQRRQQQQQEQRRQQQQLEQQRVREQMQRQIQQEVRARMQREQQQRQQTRQRQQQERSRAAASSGTQRRGGRAGGGPAVVGRGGDRGFSSSSVARLNRPLTAAEMRRGFTGKVTSDGRALVRVGNRVLAVPAARIGVRVNRVQSPAVASRWNASRRAAVSAEVQKLASTSPRNRAGAGGGGGRNNTPQKTDPPKNLPAKFKEVRMIGTSDALRFAKNANIPSTFKWRPSNTFGGVVFQHPTNTREYVRFMPGNPNSPNPAQQNPYVVHIRNDKALDVDGKRVDPDSAEAHIPAEQFKYRQP